MVPIRSAEDKAAMRAFEAILSRKDEVSYLQDLLSEREAAALLDKLHSFARWTEKIFRTLEEGTR